AADGVRAVLRLDALELGGRVGDRLVPGDRAPGLVDGGADHRLQHPVAVVLVAPGEAALHAGVPAVGLAVLPRDHAHELVAAHLGLEGAADAAVAAGGDLGPLGLAQLDHRLLGERRGRAGLHAGAAGDALRGDEELALAGLDLRGEAAVLDGQRERPLHLVA